MQPCTRRPPLLSGAAIVRAGYPSLSRQRRSLLAASVHPGQVVRRRDGASSRVYQVPPGECVDSQEKHLRLARSSRCRDLRLFHWRINRQKPVCCQDELLTVSMRAAERAEILVPIRSHGPGSPSSIRMAERSDSRGRLSFTVAPRRPRGNHQRPFRNGRRGWPQVKG